MDEQETRSHGRLIDADKMIYWLNVSIDTIIPEHLADFPTYRKIMTCILNAVVQFVNYQPTVIPAEEESE